METCWAYQCWNGWGKSCGARLVSTDGSGDDDETNGGRNLYAGVELADGWYGTAFPITGWQQAWFNVAPISGELVPDFANAAAYVKFPTLADGGATYRCCGVSGTQYGDASRAPTLHGDSCVWFQLNYTSDAIGEKPRAALARVAVRDDAIASQIGSPLNRKFELTHCWLLEDENGDPWYFDSLAKLCNYHDTSRKTLVGPGHFAYQYLRQSGDKYRLRYWTPGVAEAVVTEWDNPNTTLNSTGWKALFFDANSFPVALGTRCTGVYSDEYPQQGERDLICGMGNPASGVVTEVDQWTDEDAEAGTQHLRVESSIGGAPSIHWPTLTDDDLMIEVNDWAFYGGAGDLPLYYPDDEDDEFPIEAFANFTDYNETGRYSFGWAAQTFQRSEASRFDEGCVVSTIDTAKPAINLKGISAGRAVVFAYVSGGSRVAADVEDTTIVGSAATRIAGVPTNSWCAFSSDAPEHTTYLGFENPALSITNHGDFMYSQGGYIVERPGESVAGQGDISLAAPVYTPHVASRAPFRSAPVAKEDSLGWYYEFIPPTLRALVRYPVPQDISPEAIGEWRAWLISHSHQVESLPGDPSYIGPAPKWYRAMIVPEVEIPGFEEPQDIYVNVRGVYFPTGSEPEDAPVDSLTHAGVHV